MQATQWVNRTAQGTKWKPESAALRSRLLHAYVYRSFVYSRRARGCHRGVKNGCQSVRQKAKSCGRGRKKVSVPLVQTVPVNLQKKLCLSRSTHGHESKKQSKRIIHAGAAKKCCRNGSKSSKIIDPAASRGDAPSGAKGRATTY